MINQNIISRLRNIDFEITEGDFYASIYDAVAALQKSDRLIKLFVQALTTHPDYSGYTQEELIEEFTIFDSQIRPLNN